jgi:hypothetical protein
MPYLWKLVSAISRRRAASQRLKRSATVAAGSSSSKCSARNPESTCRTRCAEPFAFAARSNAPATARARVFTVSLVERRNCLPLASRKQAIQYRLEGYRQDTGHGGDWGRSLKCVHKHAGRADFFCQHSRLLFVGGGFPPGRRFQGPLHPALNRCSRRSVRQSNMRGAAQAFAPVRFAFSTRLASSNAPLRSGSRIECYDCDCE